MVRLQPAAGLPAGRRNLAATAARGLAGGLIYHAAIAWTAMRAGATLVTRDRRAFAFARRWARHSSASRSGEEGSR